MNTGTLLPQLIKGSTTYKLIVPEKVEEKIRYLIRKFPRTEWSGVLFTSHKGSFEEGDLTITCEDIFPMDLGTSGWTEFKMNEDVAAYMANNIDLFDCDLGLVHSHHLLGAFFSSQDVKMIQQEGNDTNCFVSLVVDTKGQYVAIVTRKVQSTSEVTVKHLGKSYEFFGEGSKQLTDDGEEVTKVVDNTVIEYFDLEVERHEVPNTLSYLDDRFTEIEKQKAAKNTTNGNATEEVWNNTNTKNNFYDWYHGKQEPKELSLFPEESGFTKEDEKILQDVTATDWTPSPSKIHAAVTHMLTCSLIVNAEKINLDQWVTKHMKNLYDKIFSDDVLAQSKDTITSFKEWLDFIVQYTLDYFDVKDVPDELLDNFDVFQTKVAEALIDEISKYSGANEYIQDYIDALSYYCIAE